jgi:quercetin dioxygenase-like cupin family protein
MPEQAVPLAVRPGEGDTIEGPVGGPITFKVRAAQTAGTMTAFENVIAPGQGPPAHTHADEDESWYVIEGHLRFLLGTEIAQAPAGSFVFVPRGTVHCFQNTGSDPARILVMFTPAGMEAFFDRFATVSADDVGPAVFKELGEPAGMTVVGPPLAQSHPVR